MNSYASTFATLFIPSNAPAQLWEYAAAWAWLRAISEDLEIDQLGFSYG